MTTKFIATRVYLKPLLPDSYTPVSPEAVLKRAKKDLLRRIRRKLTQTTFSDRAKKALSRALKIEVKESSLVIIGKHPAFGPLLRGQKAEQMTWLTKAKRPIPIVTDDGKLIFRNATSRSMENGKWHHPGRAPQDFVAKAKTESRTFLKERLAKEIAKSLRKGMRRR